MRPLCASTHAQEVREECFVLEHLMSAFKEPLRVSFVLRLNQPTMWSVLPALGSIVNKSTDQGSRTGKIVQ